MDGAEEKSLSDYTGEIWEMVNKLCYDHTGIPVAFKDSVIHDSLWRTLDLWFGYIDNMINGKCSLAQSINFDLHDEVMSKHKEITAIYKQLTPE